MSTSSSHKQRILRGNPVTVDLAVASATVIYAGDLVAFDSNYNVIPISDIADAGDAAANREAGADACIGIALTGSASGKTERVTVALGNGGVIVRLTQQTAAAIDFGDPVGPYADATQCSDQLVVEDSTSPIGMCVKHKTSTTETDVEVLLLCSKVMVLQT